MKLKYKSVITFLLVWETIVLLRVAAERNDLQEQLVAIEDIQTETIALPVEEDVGLDTRVTLPSTDEPTSRTASEWADRIKEIAPANITLTEVVATSDYVNLVGEAKSNGDIAILMRAIDETNLGSPELQQATRVGDVSEFTLGVSVRRSPSMHTLAY